MTNEKEEKVMVKCSECGLLAVRSDQAHEPVEATERTRKEGLRETPKGTDENAEMFCYSGSDKFPSLPKLPKKPEEIRIGKPKHPVPGIIGKERECSHFQKWRKGKSPKEHEELVSQQEIEHKNELEREKAREIAERHHQENLDWQKMIEEKTDRRHKTNLLVSALIAFLTTVATLVAARLLPWFVD